MKQLIVASALCLCSAGAVAGVDTETVFAKWAEEAVPAAAFDVPKGYTNKAMPSFH